MSNFSNFNFGTPAKSKSSITSSSTSLNLDDITATNATLIKGITSAPGEIALHDDGTAVLSRWGNTALCTLRVSMDEDREVILTFGPSIVPNKILTVSVNSFNHWAATTILISSKDNTISIDRGNIIGSTVVIEIFFITDGWDEFNASELFYDSSGNSLNSLTVQGAINELVPDQNLIEFNVEFLSENKTLTASENIYQYLTTNTPNLSVNLPSNPKNGTHFIIKNSTDSLASFTTNNVLIDPGDIYEIRYNSFIWIEL